MKKITMMMALILIGIMSFAQRGPRAQRTDNRAGREQFHERMIQKLDLSSGQQQQVKDLRLAHLKANSETHSQLTIKKAELEAAIKSDQPVDQLISEIGKLENQLLVARIKHRIAIRNLLDEDQKVLFDQIAGRHSRKGHEGWKGK